MYELHILPEPLWGVPFQVPVKRRKPETRSELKGILQVKK
jgi:hypothetical protein